MSSRRWGWTQRREQASGSNGVLNRAALRMPERNTTEPPRVPELLREWLEAV